jgi:hypothetical protein
MPNFSFFVTFFEDSPVEPVSCAVWVRVSMATNLTDLKPCDYFLCTYFKDGMFQKILHTIPELKTVIKSEIWALSTETLTRFLNNFVLHLHEDRDLRGKYMENVWV